jgi:hypothetical protein
MHSLGFYVRARSSFSEVSCGLRTAIYLKLANDMTPSQWAAFYRMLRLHEDIDYKMREHAKQPASGWTDDPSQYFIGGSDSVDPADFSDPASSADPISDDEE